MSPDSARALLDDLRADLDDEFVVWLDGGPEPDDAALVDIATRVIAVVEKHQTGGTTLNPSI